MCTISPSGKSTTPSTSSRNGPPLVDLLILEASVQQSCLEMHSLEPSLPIPRLTPLYFADARTLANDFRISNRAYSSTNRQ